MESPKKDLTHLKLRVLSRRGRKIRLNALQDYEKFEKTVNVLLSRVCRLDGIDFELKTDSTQIDPSSISKNFRRIDFVSRENGQQSRPDAELTQVNQLRRIGLLSDSDQSKQAEFKRLKIVIDAKFYSTMLSKETIEKTVDDMELRTNERFSTYGLIVCSKSTKLDEYHSLSKKWPSNLRVIVLEESEDQKFLRQIFYLDQELYIDELMPHYLNKKNNDLIKESILRIIKDFKACAKVEPASSSKKHKDDNYIISQGSTRTQTKFEETGDFLTQNERPPEKRIRNQSFSVRNKSLLAESAKIKDYQLGIILSDTQIKKLGGDRQVEKDEVEALSVQDRLNVLSRLLLSQKSHEKQLELCSKFGLKTTLKNQINRQRKFEKALTNKLNEVYSSFEMAEPSIKLSEPKSRKPQNSEAINSQEQFEFEFRESNHLKNSEIDKMSAASSVKDTESQINPSSKIFSDFKMIMDVYGPMMTQEQKGSLRKLMIDDGRQLSLKKNETPDMRKRENKLIFAGLKI